MAKWKCEVCGNEFENFHAQGFDNKIYCPLCYFKKENQALNKQLEDISEELELVRCDLHNRTSERDGYERELNEYLSQQKEFIKWLENGINQVRNTKFLDERIQRAGLIAYNRCLRKYKKVIGGNK